MGSNTKMMDAVRADTPVDEEEDFLPASERDRGRVVGLVLVDIVNGFCTVGAGNLVRFPRFISHLGVAAIN
ncbi:hypothetical protein IEQ34_018317 [Dendrobium chrysotoxum]|uniref:Uncharacterized protein n=1 Tax=Dendrobium chrysotoxum TaxID=161865 RepID=A0AAV7GF34_DENCH|nr:hypothetical protein IEQ34_018317 [Dendrobium chrysotoxum]